MKPIFSFMDLSSLMLSYFVEIFLDLLPFRWSIFLAIAGYGPLLSSAGVRPGHPKRSLPLLAVPPKAGLDLEMIQHSAKKNFLPPTKWGRS
jgi:hypothetical protein